MTADRLRKQLVDTLRRRGDVRGERVEAALRAVPRHLFVPGVSLEEAYADEVVYTKLDGDGVSISAASQPAIVALMLDQLQVEPGHRILEIGAGTGYNAALLADLAGPDGQVTAIDLDDDIVDGARANLREARYDVRVVQGDGALGHPDGAPYDRMIATVAAWDVPPAWWDQLAPHGRLVVPLRLRGSTCRSLALERDGVRWRSRTHVPCGFMPLRGAAGDPRRVVPLTGDGTVALHVHQDQVADSAALAGVLDHAPTGEEWTGVRFRNTESQEWLDLWLACTLTNALSRMDVDPDAVTNGLVRPPFRWGAMGTAERGALAYLTSRPVDTRATEHETGVVGHGPGGDTLVRRVVEQIRTWDRDYRGRAVQIDLAQHRITGQFTFATPRNHLAITWT